MKLIYIAGPFNAGHGRTVEENIRAAEALAAWLVRCHPSAQPVVPHSLGRVLFGIQTETAAYAGTLELMRRCDAVLTTEHWRQSTGARSEVRAALDRGMPVFDHWDVLDGDPTESTRLGRWLEQ